MTLLQTLKEWSINLPIFHELATRETIRNIDAADRYLAEHGVALDAYSRSTLANYWSQVALLGPLPGCVGERGRRLGETLLESERMWQRDKRELEEQCERLVRVVREAAEAQP